MNPPMVSRVIEVLRASVETLSDIAIQADTELLGTGLLDSFGIIHVVTAIEAAFTVRIDLDEVEVASFQSPLAIAQYVQSIRTERGLGT